MSDPGHLMDLPVKLLAPDKDHGLLPILRVDRDYERFTVPDNRGQERSIGCESNVSKQKRKVIRHRALQRARVHSPVACVSSASVNAMFDSGSSPFRSFCAISV